MNIARLKHLSLLIGQASWTFVVLAFWFAVASLAVFCLGAWAHLATNLVSAGWGMVP